LEGEQEKRGKIKGMTGVEEISSQTTETETSVVMAISIVKKVIRCGSH